MSSEPETSDAQFTSMFFFMIGGLILLAIGLLVLGVIFGSTAQKSDLNVKARDNQLVERIEPAGQINIGDVASSADTGGSAGGESPESVYQNTCAACHANGIAGAPTFGDKAAWSKHIAKGKETLYTHAIEGFQGENGMMPAKGGNTSLSDETVKAVVDYMVAAVSESADSESADSDAGASEPTESDSTADDAGNDQASAEAGEPVYQSSCAACHAAGVAGAPKFGDAAAWAPRIAKGKDTLHAHAIEGFQGDAGVMPPKGGFMNLSDEQVRAAVDYMVQQSQ